MKTWIAQNFHFFLFLFRAIWPQTPASGLASRKRPATNGQYQWTCFWSHGKYQTVCSNFHVFDEIESITSMAMNICHDSDTFRLLIWETFHITCLSDTSLGRRMLTVQVRSCLAWKAWDAFSRQADDAAGSCALVVSIVLDSWRKPQSIISH